MEEKDEMNNIEKTPGGKIDISDQVITDVVILTLAKLEGKEINQKSKEYKYYRKQVTIDRKDEDSISVAVKTKVKYGEKIPEVSKKIQEEITQEVENITGLKVIAVNVLVEDVITPNRSEDEYNEDETEDQE
ncbi:Asp23/Gls24 family envelope stress response protein [Mesoaciditoga lauensis]|uniref:Asp23/Gls24 family envelope stress response protein n=1 Tax=Mesoaciditoga lauensis TaxID=1495039 RepID=UPI00068F4717|nr:Asp23/Gls24 family envelope stress response protein [Mesoaciditoga lauensis]